MPPFRNTITFVFEKFTLSEQKGKDQVLKHSNHTSYPQTQTGKKHAHKKINVHERLAQKTE